MFDLPPPAVPVDASPEFIESLEQVTPLNRECLDRVTERYGVHPLILSVIAKVEGGRAGIRMKNTNQTYDLGTFQINTIHLNSLQKYGITEAMVQNNDCINIGIAAWYVRTVTQNQTANDVESYFRAIARYHSKNEPHISVYTEKLLEAYDFMLQKYGGRYGVK
jgi:hypothetical protein